MATQPTPSPKRRAPLSRERVLRAALVLADTGGIEGLSMRRLGQDSRSRRCRSTSTSPTRKTSSMASSTSCSAGSRLPSGRGTGRRHAAARLSRRTTRSCATPWATSLMQARTKPGPATLRHHDAVLGSLRQAGFTLVMAAHAVSVLDGYLYGFTLQQINLPLQSPEQVAAVGEQSCGSCPPTRTRISSR